VPHLDLSLFLPPSDMRNTADGRRLGRRYDPRFALAFIAGAQARFGGDGHTLAFPGGRSEQGRIVWELLIVWAA
jgi:hypothetical protein